MTDLQELTHAPAAADMLTTGIDLVELQQWGRGANGALSACIDQVYNPSGVRGFGKDVPAGRYAGLTVEVEHDAPAESETGRHEPNKSYRTSDGHTSLLSRTRGSDSFVLVRRDSEPDGASDDEAESRYTLMHIRRDRGDSSALPVHTFTRFEVSSRVDLVRTLDIESALGLCPDTTDQVSQELGASVRIEDTQEAVLDDTALSDSSIVIAYPEVARSRIEDGVAMVEEARQMIDAIGAPDRENRLALFMRTTLGRLAALLAGSETASEKL